MKPRLMFLLRFIPVAVLMAAVISPLAPTQAASSHAPAKRITISLSRQRLRAWEGNHVVLSTPVTTGNALLPTPTGWFRIFAKYSPFTFVSPWPPGSPFWYPNSPVNFAMEFQANGYYIHDAPWRTVYGKGSNSGTDPGTNYGGTHGCVNVPLSAERFLFDWAPLGTPVHIVP
jgi:lipoprotein-anchoring transpeptidase ErfK/SrfK